MPKVVSNRKPRVHVVAIAVTAREKKTLETKAKKAGQTVSVYIRNKLYGSL